MDQQGTNLGTRPCSGTYDVDDGVKVCVKKNKIDPPRSNTFTDTCTAFPIPGTKVVRTQRHGESLWGETLKVTTQLPSGEEKNYFLKVKLPRKVVVCNS